MNLESEAQCVKACKRSRQAPVLEPLSLELGISLSMIYNVILSCVPAAAAKNNQSRLASVSVRPTWS